MKLDDKVVVVTGASAGIGEALAQELGRRGAKLLLTARRKDELEAVAKGIGAHAHAVPADVTSREQVNRVLQAAVERFGHVDVWVNNAGRGLSRPVSELTDADLDEMMRVNLKSALYGMQAALPHFKQRKQGVLVNVSSMLARVPYAHFRSAYSASKAALNSLTESLRFELAQEFPDIRAVTVMPGVVATEFGNNSLGGGPDSRKLPNAQDVHEVARVIADGLEQERADIYSREEYFEGVLGHLKKLHG